MHDPDNSVLPHITARTESVVRHALARALSRLCHIHGPQRLGRLIDCDERTVRNARDELATMKLHTALNLLTVDPAAFDELLAIRKEMEALSFTESHLKQRIESQMGEASKATFPSGSVSWKRSKDSVGLNVKQLLKDQPELLEQYPLTKPGSRRFLIQA